MGYFKKTDFYTQSCLLVSPKSKYENWENKLLLQVGERFRNTNHIYKRGVVGVVVEFKRGKVICSNGILFCPMEEDFFIDFYHLLQDNKWHAITPDHQIFIQHNPWPSYTICNKLYKSTIIKHNENEKKLLVVTATLSYNPGCTLQRYILQSVKAQTIVDGIQFKYLSLNLLADSKYSSSLWEDISNNYPTDSKERLKCFICLEEIHCKFPFGITSNSVATRFNAGNLSHKTTMTNLFKHCEESNHTLFHFIAKEAFDEKCQTIILQIQKSMRKAIFCFNDNTPLKYFW